MLPTQALLRSLHDLLGPAGMLTSEADTAPYATDWRGLFPGRTAAVLRPADTGQAAAIVRLCAAAGTPLVPQGGNTSMVAGAAPHEDGSQLVLSLARMTRVRASDSLDMTLTIEAGATLQAAQAEADAIGCKLPLSISSEGSAQIGGILATNAGGNTTIRFGNARNLVLGLEVVLPDGRIWNGLRRLRKDNTGYCLRQLFVGSEGTLGIITAAVLKLVPRATETVVALCAVRDVAAALALFARLRDADPASVQAFEYMAGMGMDFVLRQMETRLPLAASAPHYALIELATPRHDARLRAALEYALESALADGLVTDAAIAESEAQRAELWALRENHAEAQRREGASVKNDVSVPVSRVPDLIERASAAVAAIIPGVRPVPFGHIGDGNIHMNFAQPVDSDAGWFLAQDHAIMDAVNDIVQDLDGSFSAEHGVGRLKTYLMQPWRGGAELELMRAIKTAIDPQGLLNPGKLLP